MADKKAPRRWYPTFSGKLEELDGFFEEYEECKEMLHPRVSSAAAARVMCTESLPRQLLDKLPAESQNSLFHLYHGIRATLRNLEEHYEAPSKKQQVAAGEGPKKEKAATPTGGLSGL